MNIWAIWDQRSENEPEPGCRPAPVSASPSQAVRSVSLPDTESPAPTNIFTIDQMGNFKMAARRSKNGRDSFTKYIIVGVYVYVRRTLCGVISQELARNF